MQNTRYHQSESTQLKILSLSIHRSASLCIEQEDIERMKWKCNEILRILEKMKEQSQ